MPAKLNRSATLLFVLTLAFSASFVACDHGGGGGSDPLDPPGDQPAFPLVEGHVSQEDITAGAIPFADLFIFGDELFEVQFNSLDGVGILVLPDGTAFPQRFTRMPPGHGRFSGPNAQSCVGCHNSPLPTSAGEIAGNVIQDPSRSGIGPFNNRNTISLFGSAVPQRLAEEITEELQDIRDEAGLAATPGGGPVTLALEAKGISYGELTAERALDGTLTFDYSGVEGVDPDLVVRPYGWKGNVTTLRDFCRGAANNELGMQADEVVAGLNAGDDPDGDGVTGELSVGDVTALVIYVGAQEIPTTRDRMVREGLLPPVPSDQAALASRGEGLFQSIGCAECHKPELRLLDPLFEEPTLRGAGHYFDPTIDPDETGLDPANPFTFNLVRQGDFPRLVPHPNGGARVRLFGDLKRHRMGQQLADGQPMPASGPDGEDLFFEGQPVLIGETVFLTPELWGVGNTGPWLHDGRAASLEEAILLHGQDTPPPVGDPLRSEAQEARDAFTGLDDEDRLAVVEFLRSLILFGLEEEE